VTGLPAISLWQPWASLIALGVKRIETRSWPCPAKYIGERVIIHAAKHAPDWREIGDYRVERYYPDVRHAKDCCCDDGVCDVCARRSRSLPALTLREELVTILPLGTIVATATITSRFPTTEIHWDHSQRPYGDFTPGRWAWLLDDIAPTTERCPWCVDWGYERVGCPVCEDDGQCEPVPAKGRQGFWRWTP